MIPPLVTLQKMAHASYHHPPREGENEIGGWTLVQGNEWIKFYAKGNEVVIATRGSQTGEDWTDANRRIPFNDLESSTVYKRDEDYIKQFKANNPQYTTYYGIGHSLSGAINDIYLRKGIVSEAVSYNPAVETQYLRAQVPNHRRIYMKDDPLYKLMGQWLVQKPEVRASKISTATWLARFTPIGNVLTADQYLKAHDIKEFEGGVKGRCKKCGLHKLTLHAVIVKKPYNLHEAKAIARDVMKSKKDKFMRETSTSYRFRNLPKTKFSSFVTKVLNPNVSLVLGNLK